MSSELIANHREQAEIHCGDAACKLKCRQLLAALSLPTGLLPLDNIVEFGHNRETGFVWLMQRRSKEHRFSEIRRTVWYGAEVTAFVDRRKMSRVTGVKSKELLLWITISDFFVPDSDPSKITFATPTGITRSFPVSSFELE